jgi:hypothetical protein
MSQPHYHGTPDQRDAGSSTSTRDAVRPHGLAAMLQGPEGMRLGLGLLLGASLLTCLVFLANAFLMPGSAYAIQDDARQFLAWTVRLEDSGALAGDLIADYWQSVTPWALRGVFAAGAAIGISPVILARLIPPVLLLVSAFAAWRVALVLTRGQALAAFLTAAFTMALLVHEDSIFSATARAFSPPLFLLFLDGLLRERRWQMVVSLGVLAATYPTTALVGLTMLGLSFLRRRVPLPVKLTRKSVITMLLATAFVGAPIALLPGEVSRWEPVITMADALSMPNLGTPGGRSSIVPIAGAYPWLCSARVGILPEILPCWASRWAAVFNLLMLVPLLFLGGRAALGSLRGVPRSPDIIYFLAVIAGLIWWAIATALAFKLHLPARYPQRVLSILEWMAIGQIIGLWLDQRLRAGGSAGGSRWVWPGLLALLAISFATPTPGIRRPQEPAVMDWLLAAPKDIRIGGLSSDLDFVPALTGRAVHVTIEHAIPYHLTYFRQIDRRLAATVNAATTPDAAALARFVADEGIDVLLIDRDFLNTGELPETYQSVVSAAVSAGEAALARGPSALQRAADGCAIIRGEQQWLIDARCLAERAS